MVGLVKGLFIIYWEYRTGVVWERPIKNVLVPSTKISKKVGVLSVEGRKKSVSCIITPYSHCAGGKICNDEWSLPLTAGGLGVL